MSEVTYYGSFVGGYEDGYLLDDEERMLIGIRNGYNGGAEDMSELPDIIFNNEIGAFEDVRKCGGVEIKEAEWKTIGFITEGKKKVDTSVYTGSREVAKMFYARIGSHEHDEPENERENEPENDDVPENDDEYAGGVDDSWDALIAHDDNDEDDDWASFLSESAVVDAVVPDEIVAPVIAALIV